MIILYRILALVRKSESRLPSFENYIKKLSTPTTHSYSARLVEFVDKSITLGKVEGAMEVLHISLRHFFVLCHQHFSLLIG